jgi:hypothetical protein
MPTIRVDITPAGTPGQFKAKVESGKESVTVPHLRIVQWNVKPHKSFPDRATAWVQFSNDGPFIAGALTHGRHRGEHVGSRHVVAGVTSLFAAEKVPFPYTFGYELDGVDTPLLDPELIVEGNRDHHQNTARKKTAKKAKKAKRSTKRKTKKR